ncbi:SRPBCC family protein [Actinomycetes bacterium KLBMP 9759]
MTGMRYRLVGTLQVELPPDQAFRLFTPGGERDWVDGWDPFFPDPSADDTEPGTVFRTDAQGIPVTWVVLDRRPADRMSYARVEHGVHAGTVTVTLQPDPDSRTRTTVTVAYDLTALDESAKDGLHQFAQNYPAFLDAWHEAITTHLT